MEMEILHFSHGHPLMLNEKEISDRVACFACEKYCSGPTYSCSKCWFNLDKSCAELPRQFQNPFHPHPLTLLAVEPKKPWRFKCDACLKDCRGFTYHCNQCNDFNLDVECAFLEPTIDGGTEHLKHFSHLHPLTLTEKKDEDNVYCNICGRRSSGSLFGCDLCDFFLHEACADLHLPSEIQHFFHPCPLSLCTKATCYSCQACNNTPCGFYYHCKQCKFMMEVECALLPNMASPGHGQIHHFSHGHPLALGEKKKEDKANCSACRKQCLGPTYICNRCQFFLHKSCVELPQQLPHPLHLSHPLTLLARATKLTSRCNACCKYCGGFTYHCDHCDFNLHVECIAMMPTISYKDHNHPLLFMENKGTEVKCNACNTPCESSVFHCAECNFNLHLLCGPLPSTIKHKCHIDPLALTDSPVDDEDTEEFYCDACEEERDPRLSVYFCAECHFIAEISCVISEVLLSLNGNYGDIELKTPDTWIEGKLITKSLAMTETWQKEAEQDSKTNRELGTEEAETKPALMDDILSTLTEDEKKDLKVVFAARKREITGAKKRLSNDQEENSDHNIGLPLFSDRAYTHFMWMLESGTKHTRKLWDNEEIVTISDFSITRSLAPILENLIAKHGDISAASMLSPKVKMYFFVMLCGTIHSMCNTKVVDITENLLLNWWNNLKTLQFSGLKTQFAFDHLKKVADAYFGLQIREQVDSSLAELDRDITKLSKDIEELTQKLKTLKGKRENIISAESSKSSSIEECLEEALVMKWRTAGTGLL